MILLMPYLPLVGRGYGGLYLGKESLLLVVVIIFGVSGSIVTIYIYILCIYKRIWLVISIVWYVIMYDDVIG